MGSDIEREKDKEIELCKSNNYVVLTDEIQGQSRGRH